MGKPQQKRSRNGRAPGAFSDQRVFEMASPRNSRTGIFMQGILSLKKVGKRLVANWKRVSLANRSGAKALRWRLSTLYDDAGTRQYYHFFFGDGTEHQGGGSFERGDLNQGSSRPV